MQYITLIVIQAIYLMGLGKFTPACTGSLGVYSPLSVTDAQLSASSARDEFTGAERGRLNLPANGSYSGGWAAGNGDNEHYIQVDLLAPYDVTGVVTQGRADRHEWTGTFEILYSTDGVHFSPVLDTARGFGARRFDGNTDQNTPVTNFFPSVTAQWIRIHPVAWMGSIALRFDVLGCHGNTVYTTTQEETSSTSGEPSSVSQHTTMDQPTATTVYTTEEQSTTATIYTIKDHSISSMFPYIYKATFEERDPLTPTEQTSPRGTTRVPSQTSIGTWTLSHLHFALATSGVAVLGLSLLIMTIVFFKQYRKTKVSAHNRVERF